MLARVDGAGLVRAGDYALTTLAAAVVQYFLADEALTRESLTLLTGTLSAQLAQILSDAKKAASADAWHAEVSGRLRVTVSDLVSGIERRQRGLDAQQEEVQAEIAKLLQADWFSAVDRCHQLLDTTTTTLNELHEILLRDTHHFLAMLQEIQELATAAENYEAQESVQRVIEHVDRIAAWGAARQQAWSEYYQYVHRYLRDVVRLDPDRALSQRLRDQTAGWPDAPFYLLVAHAPSIRLLRALEARVERPPVARPLCERETDPEWVEPENVHANIDLLVVQAIDEGAATLADVSSRVLVTLPESLHYAATGRVADAVGRIARVRSERERPWAPVLTKIEVEDWAINGRDLS
jgi:chromosome partition protein MukF